ncbi:MAG: hypothetical protein QW215_03170 [Ignisphaera sp.]
MSSITEYGEVSDGVDEWGRVRVDSLLEDGTFIFVAVPVGVVHEVYDSLTAADVALSHRAFRVWDSSHAVEVLVLPKSLRIPDVVSVLDEVVVSPVAAVLLTVYDAIASTDTALLSRPLSRVVEYLQLLDSSYVGKTISISDISTSVDRAYLRKLLPIVDAIASMDTITAPLKVFIASDLVDTVDSVVRPYRALAVVELLRSADVVIVPVKVLVELDALLSLDEVERWVWIPRKVRLFLVIDGIAIQISPD